MKKYLLLLAAILAVSCTPDDIHLGYDFTGKAFEGSYAFNPFQHGSYRLEFCSQDRCVLHAEVYTRASLDDTAYTQHLAQAEVPYVQRGRELRLLSASGYFNYPYSEGGGSMSFEVMSDSVIRMGFFRSHANWVWVEFRRSL